MQGRETGDSHARCSSSFPASTIFFWSRIPGVHEKYKAALSITSLVTFIAAYHCRFWGEGRTERRARDERERVRRDNANARHARRNSRAPLPRRSPPPPPPRYTLLSPRPTDFRIFNSWVDSYEYPPWNGTVSNPSLTGKPFNDAYRYMDWLLTVPLLLIEIVLCCQLTPEETSSKATKLGVASALMIIIGYPGELLVEQSEISGRWAYWAAAMVPFLYVVYELAVGLKAATEKEEGAVKSMLYGAQYATIISWLTYPIVYILPAFGLQGASLVIGIQVGYCISDIISKCGVGILIYRITVAKSERLTKNGDYDALSGN